MARPKGSPARIKIVRKQPPARVELCIGAAMPSAWPFAKSEHGQRRVDDDRPQSLNGRRVRSVPMDMLFIHGRVALADASDLIERYGDDAGFEAASRAERSRDNGNVERFCHWRQIERVIATLSSDEIVGTVH